MYTIVFRKGSVELQLSTDDKEFIEKQLDAIIYQASNVVASKTMKEDVPMLVEESSNSELIQNAKEENVASEEDSINEEKFSEPHIEPAQFHHITEEEKKAVIQNAEDVVPQSLDIGNVKPLTINSLQNPEPESEPNFDNILSNEMNNQDSGQSPVLKDEKFIQYVESKSAIEKIDFLVITAQYLAQFEGLITFNLKHINAKLMQNFTLIVDHSVLQSAISKEYITLIQEGSDDSLSGYMLTEKGLRSY